VVVSKTRLGVAKQSQFSKLAQNLSTTASGLLRPFWRSLSITIVKNLQSRPHMAEQLCDLLGMSVDDFLRFTEVHTLPYLVYTRKRDTIARIAAAYHTKSPFDLCMERNNLASILAFLLSQPSQDPEVMIYSFLIDVDAKFHNSNVNLLLKSEPIPITRELLKYIGDAGDDNDSRVREAHGGIMPNDKRTDSRINSFTTLFVYMRTSADGKQAQVPRLRSLHTG
jgi:serine/threonine-protein kinase ATR